MEERISGCLRREIKRSRRSYNDLGRATGTAPSCITRFMSGRDIRLLVADRLCRVLDLQLIHVDELDRRS